MSEQNSQASKRSLIQEVQDFSVAVGTDVVSAFCARFQKSKISQRIMGAYPTRWYMARTRAGEIDGWRTVAGDASSGRFPADYNSSAIVHTDWPALQNLTWDKRRETGRPVVPAVAV